MLIHTDQKPFQCDACEQSFRQKQLLKRHQNLYHNPNYVPPTPKVSDLTELFIVTHATFPSIFSRKKPMSVLSATEPSDIKEI